MEVQPYDGGENLSSEETDQIERSNKRIKEGADKAKSFLQTVVWGKRTEAEVQAQGTIDQIVMEEEESFTDDDEPEPVRIEGIPFVSVDKEKRDRLRRPWPFSIIVKLLGKSFNFPVFKQRLKNLWNLKEEDELIDLGYGYYVIKFRTKEAAAKILSGGPWKIMDHYLVVQRWKPNFRPSMASIGKMAIWIRLPELPIEYFNMDMLMDIGKQLGKAIRLDTNTSSASRGKFARICVEVDLSKPLVSRVQVQGLSQAIEYEALHTVCFSCGIVGHRMDK